MKVPAKTEYACIAILELAARYDDGQPVCVRDIAAAHGIPSRFLVQILLQLKGAGLVASTRGAAGGYRLLQPPEQITLAAVMAVVEGPLETPSSNVATETALSGALLATWREVAELQHEILGGMTLANLLEQAQGAGEAMYYI
jgi:Rrf2 family protein